MCEIDFSRLNTVAENSYACYITLVKKNEERL
jgi:hypothetical protein